METWDQDSLLPTFNECSATVGKKEKCYLCKLWGLIKKALSKDQEQKWYNLIMENDFIDEHIDDEVHSDKIESNLDKALQEQNQMKRLIDLFMLALILIFAVYSFF